MLFAVLVMRFRRSASELNNSADVLIGPEPSKLAGIVKFHQSLIAGFRGRLSKIYIATPKVSFIPAQGEALGVDTPKHVSSAESATHWADEAGLQPAREHGTVNLGRRWRLPWAGMSQAFGLKTTVASLEGLMVN